MNKRNILIHKGVDNSIKFRVFDPDRTPVNVCTYNLYARIFNVENRELVLEKLCTTSGAKGMVSLDLNEGDITNLAHGLYDLVIVGQRPFIHNQTVGESVTTPFFTDYASNIVASLEITPQAERVPKPTYEITADDWTFTKLLWQGNGPVIDQLYSSAIPGARVQNHTNSTHSFSVMALEDDKFTGTLEVLGTLDVSPEPYPNDHGWFRIQVAPGTDVLEFVDFYGTEAFTFAANIMFIKFRYTPSHLVTEPGKIEKILVRS